MPGNVLAEITKTQTTASVRLANAIPGLNSQDFPRHGIKKAVILFLWLSIQIGCHRLISVGMQ